MGVPTVIKANARQPVCLRSVLGAVGSVGRGRARASLPVRNSAKFNFKW